MGDHFPSPASTKLFNTQKKPSLSPNGNHADRKDTLWPEAGRLTRGHRTNYYDPSPHGRRGILRSGKMRTLSSGRHLGLISDSHVAPTAIGQMADGEGIWGTSEAKAQVYKSSSGMRWISLTYPCPAWVDQGRYYKDGCEFRGIRKTSIDGCSSIKTVSPVDGLAWIEVVASGSLVQTQ